MDMLNLKFPNTHTSAELHCFIWEMYLAIRNKGRAVNSAHFKMLHVMFSPKTNKTRVYCPN